MMYELSQLTATLANTTDSLHALLRDFQTTTEILRHRLVDEAHNSERLFRPRSKTAPSEDNNHVQ